jgi:hypothetical protein
MLSDTGVPDRLPERLGQIPVRLPFPSKKTCARRSGGQAAHEPMQAEYGAQDGLKVTKDGEVSELPREKGALTTL